MGHPEDPGFDRFERTVMVVVVLLALVGLFVIVSVLLELNKLDPPQL